jgi:hypothetical protein
MEKVTKRSSLAAVSKKQILEKINEIKREHNILKTRFSDIKNEILKLEIVSRKIKAWVASTEPLLFKSAKENVSYKKLFKYLLLGLFIFTSLGFIFFLFLNKKSIEAAKYIFEKKLVSILDLIIIKNDLNFMSEYSTKTQNSILSYAEYLKKRVNFGLLFQEAMPLPSVMLDRHLNIKWFNKHFLEQWGFDAEELLNTNKNWQNLREKTNIGTNDPIMESLESNIAGIYQIQIKNIKEEKPRPYQMYVSPVTVYGEQSIMLFFYPLMTLEETVEIQTRSIVEPVKETLEVILNNGYDDRYEVESIRNYNIAGIEDIHEKFSKIFKKHKDEVDVLLKEINDLEQTIKSDHKIIKDFEDINQNASLNVQGQLDKFKKLKNDIIQISTLANKGFGNYFDQKRGILGFTEDFKYFATKYQSFNKELNTFINSLPLIQQMKQNIKSNKDDFKKLSFALVNLNKNFERTFEKVELSGHKKTMIYQNLSDLKKCLKNLEGFEKNLMSVDIFFSKFALIVEELLKKSENEVLMDQFLELKSELNKLLRALDEHRIDQSHIDQAEEQIVASIREFYHHIKSNYKIYEALPSSQELSN